MNSRYIFTDKEVIKMGKVRTRFAELTMQKLGVTKVDDVDRMVIVREANISYPTVTRWLTGDVDRFDTDTLARLCAWLKCNIADLLYIEEDTEE